MDKKSNKAMMTLKESAGLLISSNLPAEAPKQEKAQALVTLYGDKQRFGAAFNPSVQKVIAQNLERAYVGKAPTLAVVKEAFGLDPAEGWIMAQLEDLNEFSGVAVKMSPEQMEETARLILQEYPYFKVTELMLFMHRFKCGNYGTLYGVVDPLVVMQALFQFASERRAELTLYENRERKRKLQEDREKWQSSPTAMSYSEWKSSKKKEII